MSSLLHKYKSALYLALLMLCFVATATYSFQVAQADYPSQPPSYNGGGGDNDGDSSYDGSDSGSSRSSSPDVRSCSSNGATYVSNGDGTYSRYDSNGNSTGNVSGSFVQQHGDSSGAGSGCSGGCSGGSSSVDTSNDGIASN